MCLNIFEDVRCKLFFLVVCIASVILLSGCALGSRGFRADFLKKPHSLHSRPVLLNEYQARFSDIPFPFDGQIVREEQNQELDKGLISQDFLEQNYSDQNNFDETKTQIFDITCLTNLSLPELRTLYHTEMEQLGWRERAFFQDSRVVKEKLLMNGFTFIFEKPDTTLCIISAQCSNKAFYKKKYTIHYYRA